VSGLLQKGLQIRNSASDTNGLVLGKESGISPEDQKEILSEIEQIARENKIRVTPSTFVIKPLKRGVLFPVIVNVAALLALAAGLAGLYFFFTRQEARLVDEGQGVITAQGRLIQALKQESEARLAEKDAQINQITTRLADIDQQRQNLQSNMEERISQREQELRQQLQEELAAERQRLQGQGVSQADIDAQIKQLEQERTAQFQQQISEFRTQAQQERQRLEDSLTSLSREYNAALAQANQERDAIVEQSQQRETELRQQLAQTIATSQEQLGQAQTRIQQLTQQQEQAQLVNRQLVGFYTQIRQTLSSQNYDQALTQLAQVRTFLTNQDVISLGGIEGRQSAEIFIVDSLTRLVQNQLRQRQTETAQLVENASRVQEITKTVNDANAALENGNTARAEELYTQALSTIPEIKESHDYFMTQQRGNLAARNQTASASVTQAQQAYAARDYQRALDAYQQAISELPQDAVGAAQIIAQIREASVQLNLQELRQEDTSRTTPIVAQAQSDISAGRYQDAVSSLLTALVRYPNSTQAEEVTTLVRQAVYAQRASISGNLADLRSQVADLTARNAELAQNLETAQSQQGSGTSTPASDARIQELTANIDTLQKRLDSLQGENADLKSTVASLQQGAAQAPAGPVMDDATQKELARLRALETRFDTLKQEYQNYSQQEDQILAASGETGRIQTKLLLDSFLATDEVQNVFPGLRDRVKAYDKAFEQSGRRNAILELSDMMYNLSTFPTAEAKHEYLAQQRQTSGTQAMQDFIDEVDALLP